jgi:cobalt-zinc-cadmium efflux system outer membrane protein
MTNNPAIARAVANIGALRGKWVQVGLPPNPTIGYAAEDIGLENTAGRQGGFVRQQLITGGKLRLNRAIVSQEIAEAEQKLAAVQQRVVTDVRAGYYRVLIAQRQIELARELLKISQQAVDTSEALLRAREVNEVAVLQNSLQAQDAQILLRRAVNEHSAAWKHLSSVVGDPELARAPLLGDLQQGIDPLEWEDVLGRLLRQSPEMARAAAALTRARRKLARALVQFKPDVNVQATVQQESITDETLAAVQVGLPVPIWDRNQGAIRQARADIFAAERNIDRLELQLRDRLADEFNRYQSARYEVELYSSEILPKARRTLDLVTRGYQQGEIGYLNQLAAQRTFFETNLSYMRAQRQLWNARLRINGMLLDDSLGENG